MTEWSLSSTSRASGCNASSPTGAPSTRLINGESRKTTPTSSTWRWRDIDHSRTKANHPQTNGICERFQKTRQDECYSLLFRKKLYRTLEELQVDLDAWLEKYDKERPHSGRYCYGKTPWETFQQSGYLSLEKDLSRGR